MKNEKKTPTGTTLLLSRSVWVVLSSLRKYYRRLDQQLSVHVYRRCGELEKVAQSLVLEHSEKKGGAKGMDSHNRGDKTSTFLSFLSYFRENDGFSHPGFHTGISIFIKI